MPPPVTCPLSPAPWLLSVFHVRTLFYLQNVAVTSQVSIFRRQCLSISDWRCIQLRDLWLRRGVLVRWSRLYASRTPCRCVLYCSYMYVWRSGAGECTARARKSGWFRMVVNSWQRRVCRFLYDCPRGLSFRQLNPFWGVGAGGGWQYSW